MKTTFDAAYLALDTGPLADALDAARAAYTAAYYAAAEAPAEAWHSAVAAADAAYAAYTEAARRYYDAEAVVVAMIS